MKSTTSYGLKVEPFPGVVGRNRYRITKFGLRTRRAIIEVCYKLLTLQLSPTDI